MSRTVWPRAQRELCTPWSTTSRRSRIPGVRDFAAAIIRLSLRRPAIRRNRVSNTECSKLSNVFRVFVFGGMIAQSFLARTILSPRAREVCLRILAILFILTLFLGGVQLRRWTGQNTRHVRYQHDIVNGFYWGQEALKE